MLYPAEYACIGLSLNVSRFGLTRSTKTNKSGEKHADRRVPTHEHRVHDSLWLEAHEEIQTNLSARIRKPRTKLCGINSGPSRQDPTKTRRALRLQNQRPGPYGLSKQKTRALYGRTDTCPRSGRNRKGAFVRLWNGSECLERSEHL